MKKNPTIKIKTAYEKQRNLSVSQRKKQNLFSKTLQKGVLLQIETFGLSSSHS